MSFDPLTLTAEVPEKDADVAVNASPSSALASLKLHEEVGRGARSVVYRATRGDEEYAVKFYQGSRNLAEARRMFRREAAIHASVRHTAIQSIFEVGVHEARPYIITEFVRGQTLADRLLLGPLSEAATLKLAQTLASALVIVHRQGLVHRDIKPRNILIAQSGDLKLIDFGLAGQNEREMDGQVVGTFRYSAPEQLGLLQRPVDARADLYALGNVLYECVAGVPPFTTENISDLLHQHAAVRPERLDVVCPGTPLALALIIDKLLNKDPDERYQSAQALLLDLDHIHELQEGLQERLKAQTLHSGTQEVSSTVIRGVLGQRGERIVRRGVLVGRGPELSQLGIALKAARQNNGSVVLVQGAPGSGKSRLVEEFIHRSVPGNVLLLRTRCAPSDPYPLAPLRDALRTHIAQVEAEHPEKRAQSLAALNAAAGGMGGLLTQHWPELGRILEDDTAVRPARDARELFYNALSSFLLTLADAHQGAVVWIDDVQQLDDASREALLHVAAQASNHSILLLLTARNDAESQPVLESLREDFSPFSLVQMTVGPLKVEDVRALIAERLGGALEESFVRQLTGRSNGNPLIVWQYLQAMKEAGVLVPHWGQWSIDAETLSTIPLPTDVFALMTRRLSHVAETTRQILAVAALLGSHIEPEQLLYVWNPQAWPEVQAALNEGLEFQLIQLEANASGYSFVHDRIRESLLTTLDPDLRAFHRRAADFLELRATLKGRDVFERARHHLLGYAESRPQETFCACLDAATLANAEHAYARAYQLLETLAAFECLESLPVELKTAFHREMGTAAFQTERIHEAVQHYQAALKTTPMGQERTALRAAIARATIFSLNTADGARELEQAFAELERPLPSAEIQDPAALQSRLLSVMAESLSLVASPTHFGSATEAERPILRAVIDMCDTGFLVGYYSRNLPFAMQCGILALAPASALGDDPEACRGYVTFAFLMGLMGKKALVREYGGRAVEIARRLGNRQALANTQSTFAIALHLSGESDEALTLQAEVFEEYADWLGPVAFQNCCVDLSWNYQVRGMTADELRVSQAAILRLSDREGVFVSGYVCRASASAMAAEATLGDMSQAHAYLQAVMRLKAVVPADRAVPWISVAGFRVGYFLQQREFGADLEAAVQDHQAWGIPPERSALHSKHFYVYHAYARYTMALEAVPARTPAQLDDLKQAVKQLEAAATPTTLKTHLKVLEASVLALEGQVEAAFALLDEARRLGGECDNPWALLEEACLRARLLKQLDKGRLAQLEAQRAQQLAAQQGWRARKRRIEQEFQLSSGVAAVSSESSKSQTHASGVWGNATHLERQLEALISLSRASASVLNPDVLASIALDEICRILGAERAYLFIVDESLAEDSQRTLQFQCGRSASREALITPTAYSRTIVEKVYDSGQSLILSTRSDAQLLESESVMAYDLRSVLAAPLRAADRVLGVVYLDNRLARGIFTQEHAELLGAMGSYIAAALQTARSAQLEAQLQAETQKRRLAETLRELNSRLTSTLHLGEGLERLLDALARELEFELALVALEGGEALEAVVTRGFEDDTEVGILTPFYAHPAVQEHLVGAVDAVILPPGLPGMPPGKRTWMALPLCSRDARTGFVFLARPHRQPFRQEDREMGMTLSGQAGIAIDNARLFTRVKTLAERDGLTGLFNRREFFRRADRAFDTATADDQPMAAIMFDVDHFKLFNDRYGHAVGDQVLRLVARVSADSVRKTDLLGRYGGEEFCILLPGATLVEANEVGERVRKAIEETRLAAEGFGELSVTVSVGLATRIRVDELSAMLSRADQALYMSKKQGRNRVTPFPMLEGQPNPGAENWS